MVQHKRSKEPITVHHFQHFQNVSQRRTTIAAGWNRQVGFGITIRVVRITEDLRREVVGRCRRTTTVGNASGSTDQRFLDFFQ